MSRPDLSRRSFVAGGAALAASTLVGCSATKPVPREALDGAGLEAVLRGSFLPEINVLTRELANRWEGSRDAEIELVLSEDWKALVAEVARDRSGADIGDLHGNDPHLMSDRLVDVSELSETLGEELGGWAPEARSTCMVDGVWRAVPWSTTRHALVVRTDLFADVGAPMPASYDDLLEAAVRLHDAGAPRLACTMSDAGPIDASAFAYGLLWSFGGSEIDDNGRVALDSAETRRALGFYGELAAASDPRAFEFGHPDNNAAYLVGDIAATQNPSSIYLAAREQGSAVADATVHVPLPAGPAGQFHLPEMNSLGVFRHSPDPVACFDFIEFVLQRDALIDRAQRSLGFHAPLAGGVDADPAMPWNTDDRLAGLSADAAEGRMPGWPLPPSAEAGIVYENNSIVRMFRRVGTGEMTVDEALRLGVDELRRVYET